ncbi:protein indeterminate-domain 5, chloroplastic-like isoform X1 [Nicotiana sylvestris]|nr:PREDICTED: zinc finger protein JACKDAW-like isoform X2 [Nicotiana sylvestris]
MNIQQEVFLQQQQYTLAPSSSMAQTQAQATPTKKRRNQPGTTPYPDAEVIALSPKSLMATNRFLCEVCNKGFQREQNLQLHRRGHNLPWKLKQKNTKEVVKRKVYLCPEITCVHHEISRALGDLTGIKKHYFRKHGEKKFKCEKCSKKYAVQSDWKAHTKTCGTREYRCDCGTLFSRRDSFITHRAFCVALAQETARNPVPIHNLGNFSKMQNSTILDQKYPSSNSIDILSLGNTKTTHNQQFNHNLIDTSNIGSNTSNSFFFQESNQDYANIKPIHDLMQQLPNFHNNNMFNLNFFQNNDGNSNMSSGILGDQNISCSIPSLYGSQVQNHNLNSTTTSSVAPMSATALLQKAAQMGSTTSNISTTALLLKAFGNSTNGGNSSSSGTKSDHQVVNFGDNFSDHSGNHLHDINGEAKNFGTPADIVNGVNAYGHDQNDYGGGYNAATKLNFEEQQHQLPPQKKQLTRDFLGVGEIVRSMSGGFSSQREQQQQQQSNQGFISPENFQ